jgi:phage gp29-like protein
LGVSAYSLPDPSLPSLDDVAVEQTRRAFGGQLSQLPGTRTRWYLDELEAAEHSADTGDMSGPAQLMNAAGVDGVLAGVMSTRTAGLVQLPKRFRGPANMVDALQPGGTRARSVFDEMFPTAELAQLVADGIRLGVGIAELVPVEGRAHPVLVRLNPEFLVYRWNENRWYYRSFVGLLPVIPGDGRWVLHIPGARMAPWRSSLWRALGRAYIRKEHASLYKDAWEAKLAHPARVAVAPAGSTEEQHQSWFRKVMSWGVNTVFALKPGYEVKLLESNGKGYESFLRTIADQNNEFIIAVAGQTVTTDGGTGFANADIHKTIRADLIKGDGAALAHTLNTQGIPQWTVTMFGEDALADSPTVEWDTAPPKDKTAEAAALVTAANAITTLTAALADHGLKLDVDAIATKFGIPVQAIQTAPVAANDVAPVVPIKAAA